MATSADDTLYDARAGSGRPVSALIVDPEPGTREALRHALGKCCGFVEDADSAATAQALMSRCHFDVLIVDDLLPDGSGTQWVQTLRSQGLSAPVIFLSGRQEMPSVTHACWVTKPVALDDIHEAIHRMLGPAAETSAQPREPTPPELQSIVGRSEAMRGLLTLIRRVAGRNSTVLLEGESGTGKEIAARCLHYYSGRTGPFVPVNCGSISPDLLESELFGHVRGAFTGASQSREGLFSYANGGTLFLDEIGEMPMPFQAKLLRVLEERSVRPVGTEREQTVDVRIVAATNRRLADEVSSGRFREDLYFRLNVLALRLPPLRERPSDIPQLARLFSEMLSRELGLPPLELNEADLHKLQSHPWPGNVRELKNLIERALLLGRSPAECLDGEHVDAPISLGNARSEAGYPLDMPLDEVEKRHALRVLAAAGGNKSEAARRLRVSRKTLERKIKRWEGH